jgi:hypothetical protein
VKRQLNALLRKRGYMITKIAAPPRGGGPPKPRPYRRQTPRLLREPAFVLSTVRSGSTLLRMMIDSHSQIHSPHEMHLRSIDVKVSGKYGDKALAEVKLDRAEMRSVLWDWYLHRELATTGKKLLVNKTPNDVFITDEIQACWPDARFIFLLRHPLSVARSRGKLRPQDADEVNYARVLKYAEAVEHARSTLPGHTIRYEDLTADPAGELQKLCAFLGVAFEPTMVEYGKHSQGRFKPGMGDWKDAIRTGEVQAAKPLPAPDEVPELLRPIAAAWGYLEAAAPPLERAEG